MDIALSEIIQIGNLSDYKIHFAVWNDYENPLDVFIQDPEEWMGWNAWKTPGNRNDFITSIFLA
jgi:hypothetical protein